MRREVGVSRGYLAKENTEGKKIVKRLLREKKLKRVDNIFEWQLCLRLCGGWVLSAYKYSSSLPNESSLEFYMCSCVQTDQLGNLVCPFSFILTLI